jgi:hypothetical protein
MHPFQQSDAQLERHSFQVCFVHDSIICFAQFGVQGLASKTGRFQD